MFEDLNILLKQSTGCGIFLFKSDEELEEALKYIESNTEENNYILITAEDIGVLDIEEFLKQKLKEKGFTSLKEFAEKQLRERKKLVVVIKNIEYLSFEQLKSFEKLCKEARSSFSLFLLGKEKIQSLIDSFYLKDLRKNAVILYNCGNLKKEEIKEFTEKYFKTTLGKDISVEAGVESILYKLSEGNEKKLEQVLTKLAGYIKDNLLSKEILNTYLKDKGIEISSEEKQEVEKNVETKGIDAKKIGFVTLTVVFIGALLIIFTGKGKKATKEVSNLQQVGESVKDKKLSTLNVDKDNENVSQQEKQLLASESKNIPVKEEKKATVEKVEKKVYTKKYFPLKKVIFLREKPDIKSKKIARVTNKQLLEAVDENKEWLKVKVKKGEKVVEGWVKREQVTVVPEGKGVIFAKSLNLREHPSLTAKIIKSIPYGTVVDVEKTLNVENRTWYKISYIDQNGNIYEGWVSGKYVIYNKKED